MGGSPRFKSQEEAAAFNAKRSPFISPATWDYASGGKQEFLGMFRDAAQATSDQAQRSITPPPETPDLTDKSIELARLRARALAGGGRSTSFLTGPLGVKGPAPVAKPSLYGS